MFCYRRGANLTIPFVDEITRNPQITDRVASILGPDILCWSCTLFIKEPETADFVSWHQDLHYWGLNDNASEVTAWVALSPSTVENGCVKFVPGSHKSSVAHKDTKNDRNMLSRGQEVAVDVDEKDAVQVELRPGQFSLHHGLVFHGSNANRSKGRRIGVAVRYISTKMKNTGSARTDAVLVRGRDDYGNFDLLAAPTGLFVPSEVERVQASFAKQDAYNLEGARTS